MKAGGVPPKMGDGTTANKRLLNREEGFCREQLHARHLLPEHLDVGDTELTLDASLRHLSFCRSGSMRCDIFRSFGIRAKIKDIVLPDA